MRPILIACGGIALSVLLLIGSSQLEGLPGASLFILGYMAIPVALGVAISMAWPLRVEHGLLAKPNMISSSRFRRTSRMRCGQCGSARTRRAQVWVCSLCDESASAFELR